MQFRPRSRHRSVQPWAVRPLLVVLTMTLLGCGMDTTDQAMEAPENNTLAASETNERQLQAVASNAAYLIDEQQLVVIEAASHSTAEETLPMLAAAQVEELEYISEEKTITYPTTGESRAEGEPETAASPFDIIRHEEADTIDEEPVNPLVISEVKIEAVTATSATIFWQLNDKATGQIEFGTTTEYGSQTKKEESFKWDGHRQSLSGLEPETEYHFRVESTDQDGNTIVSEDHTVTTEKAPEVPIIDETDGRGSNNEPVAGWPDNTSNNLPMGGVFYGNHEAGILTGNARIGVDLSRRFRAERTGYIDAVRWNNRTLSGTNIAGRCLPSAPNSVWCKCKNAGLDRYTCGYTLGNSYSVGNGGQILIEIREDDGSSAGQPRTGEPLGQARSVFIPMDNANTHYPIVELQKAVPITAGKIYHVVYRNLAPPSRCGLGGVSLSQASSCPRNQGAIGLNGVYFPSRFSNGVEFDPFRGSSNAVLYRDAVGGPWKKDSDNLSWYEVRYNDNIWVGDGVAAYNSIFHGARHHIGGNTVGRQVFTVRDATRRVNGLWIHHGHASTADGSSMSVKLKDSRGSTLATGTIAANKSCITTAGGSSWGQKECRSWTYTNLSKTVDLLEGSRYSVELSAGSRAAFALSSFFPLNYGSYQSKERGFWRDAQAEISTNGGSSWSGWAGSYYAERDLGLLFTIDGMPKKLE